MQTKKDGARMPEWELGVPAEWAEYSGGVPASFRHNSGIIPALSSWYSVYFGLR